jgi:hypothetical protein
LQINVLQKNICTQKEGDGINKDTFAQIIFNSMKQQKKGSADTLPRKDSEHEQKETHSPTESYHIGNKDRIIR